MANEECTFEARVTEGEILDLNSPEGLENAAKYMKQEREDQPDNNDKSLSQMACEELTERKSDELFENVPELKEAFVIKSKIGEGTFSNVYLAHLVGHPEEMFALKHIIPTSSPDRVEREVRCLQEMGGKNNVIGYKGTIRHCDHNVIILPYFPHERFQDYFHSMTTSDIQSYMKNLLLALKHIHSFSIIHRDIKPGNFLHSRKSGRYNLVDFGLAMHEPDSEKAWDIEKKNGKYTKSSEGKNARKLSPESSKNGQVTKKQRTSPRVTFTSHKLARQPNDNIKTTAKATMKLSSRGNGNKLSDTSSRQTNRSVKFAAPNQQEKKPAGKSLLPPLKLASGLCQTKHRVFEVCSLCVKRTTQSAPRAGTSGFRAPEVLLKHPQQTTAVDVWSAGIVMLCLLSGKYPFFRCMDDMTALAQIITVFGKQRVMDSTKHLGKYMVSNCTSPGYELKDLCQKLRFAKRKENDKTKCCSSCSEREVKNEYECKLPSPASNLRRTSLGASNNTGKSSLNEGDSQTTDDEGNRQAVYIERKDSLSTKCSKIGDSREKNIGQVGKSEITRTEMLESSKAKLEAILRNFVNSPLKTFFDDQVPESNDPRSNNISDVISPKLETKTKIRFLPEGNRPLSENSEVSSRDDTGSRIPQEHLDGSRCICDCGSCPEYVPKSAYHLLERCLDLNPATRITASEALSHPFLCDDKFSNVSSNPRR